MAAELKINDAGTWRTITELKVNDAGTWRTIQDVKVNDSGTWRTVFINDVISIADQTIEDIHVAGAAAAYQVNADGKAYQSTSAGVAFLENWITPQTNMAAYTVRAHQNSGGALDGSSSALDSDLACSSSRTWVITRIGVGSNSANLTITIKRDGVTMDTATVIIVASAT